MLPTIDLGPIDLQTFGLSFALAFVASGLLLSKRLRELGKPVDWAYEIVFAGLLGGLIGSRLDYVIQNWETASEDLLGSLLSGSGLVWFGGLVGGAIGVLLWARWRGFLGLALLDVACVPLAMGYAIGRIGCQLSGDGDYGVPSDLPWAMPYPDGVLPTTDLVHPTPIYETLTMGLIAIGLWSLRDKLAPGKLFALYLVLAGVERLLIEFIRRNEAVLAGLTFAQLLSVLMIIVGGLWLGRGGGVRPAAA